MLGTSKSISGFDPRSVPGCALWLDGADTSSMTLSGSNVTQWNDKSGNGYVMTNNQGTTTVATSSLNSLTTVYTPSGTNTRITNFVGRTKCTIFLVGKAAISRYLLSLNGGFLYTANDSLLYFSPPTGNYLDLVDSVSGSIVSNNTWFILCIGYDNATNSTANPYTINGTTRSTTITPRGTPGILTDQNITSTLYINSTNGTNSYDSVYTAEILYYNDTLTTSQRQQVEGYLAHKWGLTGYYDSSTPLSIPGCRLWLDAADSSTITGTTSITAWRDKSGRGNNAVFTGTNPSYVPASNVVITANLNQGFTVPAATIQQTTGSGSIFLVYGDQQTQGSSYAALFSSPLPAQSFCQSLKRPDSYSYQFNNSTSPVLATVVNALNTTNTIIYTMNYTYNSTTGSIRVNGTTCASSFNSSPTPSGALTISSSGWGDGANVRLYEIITFVNDVPLTTVQQQQIETYLAKKWGFTSMYPSIPSTHPFSSVRPHLRPFQLIDVPGCQLWLDGADPAGTGIPPANGATVSTWVDKSGNGKHATAGGTTPTYSSSTRSIVFGGAGYFTNSTLSLPLSTRSVFIVCRQTSRAAEFEGIMLLSSPSVGDLDYDSSTTIPYFASGSNVVVGDTAFSIYNRGTYVQNYRPYVLTPLGIYVDVFGSSSGTLYVNGATNSTDADSSGLGTASGYILGARKISGTTLSTFFNGTIYEILVYNTALTASERQQVEGYLAHKWGLTPSLPVISPLSIPGCQLWLDGADQSSMTLSGSSITQLRDKSGNGNHMVSNGTSPLYNSSLINSVGGIDCTNGGALISSGIQNSANISFAMVAVVKSGIRNWGSFFTHGDRDYDFAVERQENTSSINFQTANDNSSCTITFTVDAPVLYFGTMTSGTSRFFESFSGGVNTIVNGTNPSTISLGSKIIRVGKSDNNNEPCNSFIGEIIYYTTVLTTTQRQQVEGYLARKWGISIGTTLPSPHPFRSFPPATLPFSLATISGLALWLDAADSTTVTGTTTVTQWRDKSGNRRNPTITGAISYANSGISITGSSSYLTGSFGSSDYTGSTVTCFVVASMSSSSGSVGRFLSLGKVGTQDGDNLGSATIGRAGGLVVRAYRNGPTQSPPSIPAYDTRFLATWGQTSSSLFNSINGGTVTTASVTGAFAINAYRIGSDLLIDDVNEQLNGVINEIIVYFSELTAIQRQQVEGYLAHKWGLVPPSSTVPLTIPGCRLWLDAADTSSLTLSGSTVTQWRDKSGLGNSPTVYSGVSYSTGQQNSLGTVNLGNYSGSMTGTITPSLQNSVMSCFFVFKLNATSDNNGSHSILLFPNPGSGDLRTLEERKGNFRFLTFNPSVALISTPAVAGSYVVWFSGQNTTNMYARLNGTPLTPVSISTNAINSSQYGIGTNFETPLATPTGWNGYVAEMIVYNSLLSVSQQQEVETYLARKWGIGTVSSIPSTHPYSKLPPA
jgi:hypothetical protein